jgi:hypothetical protein
MIIKNEPQALFVIKFVLFVQAREYDPRLVVPFEHDRRGVPYFLRSQQVHDHQADVREQAYDAG